MFPISISLVTAVAGVAFGVALLWVMSQWLQADQAATVAEHDVRKGVLRLQRQAGALRPSDLPRENPVRESPLRGLDRYGEPFPVTAAAELAAEEDAARAAEKALPLGDDETALSRLLFGWGGSGLAFGMVFGAVLYGVVGATMGGVLGSTLGIVAVTIGVSVVDRMRRRDSRPEQK